MFFETVLIGIALSMDAFGVTISSSATYPNLCGKKRLCMPFTFAIFQGLMPILGYFLGNVFSDFINTYSKFISFIILFAVGANMIKEGWQGEENEKKDLNIVLLLMLGLATSIDAFAVGISFAAMAVEIFSSSIIICVCTFIITLFGLSLGKLAEKKLGNKSIIFGGAILVLLGIKSLF